MNTRIRLQVEKLNFTGRLYAGGVSSELLSRLPLRLTLSRWGEEYYGGIGKAIAVPKGSESREEMEVGELAYWPPGKALCLFFGPTPASLGGEPRAASPVHPLGIVEGDFAALGKLGSQVAAVLEVEAPESPAEG